MPARPAARPELPPRRQRGGVRSAEPLDPRRQAFWDTERWSLLWLEPPEHTRIRKLVAAAFTPRSVEALRAPAAELARELLPERPLRPAPRLRPAVLDRRHLPAARRPHRPSPRPARLVARDGEDVRARHDRAAGRGGDAAAAEFRDYVARAGRAAPPRAAGRPGHCASSRPRSTAGGSPTPRSSRRSSCC